MRVQAINVADGGRTWTVLGDDHRLIGPIEVFLEYHRVIVSSPSQHGVLVRQGPAAVVAVSDRG